MWLEKLGNYFIDVSKYVLTGVVITSFFKDFGESKLTIYGIGTAFAIIILIVGLILTNKKDNNKRRISNGSIYSIYYDWYSVSYVFVLVSDTIRKKMAQSP